MNKITPHLWFDKEAKQAAEFYAATFPDSKVTSVTTLQNTPSGDTDLVTFEVWGMPFMAISAGPLFKINPSISFHVLCDSPEQVDQLWAKLSDGGTPLMPLGEYPFSKRYGWIQDRFGVSWQLITASQDVTQRIVPVLMFTNKVSGKAEDAIQFYTSVFPDSEVRSILYYEKGQVTDPNAKVVHSDFSLFGIKFGAMDSGIPHEFTFNEAVSLIVSCDTQQDIDRYWQQLSAVPEAEQCGWLKDKYGVSWQIVPSMMSQLMGGDPETVKRVTQAFLKIKKFDIAELQRAAEGK